MEKLTYIIKPVKEIKPAHYISLLQSFQVFISFNL